MDVIVQLTHMIVFGTLNFIDTAILRNFAKGMTTVQQYINKNAMINYQELKRQMKYSSLRIIPCFLLFIIGQFFVLIGVFYQIKSTIHISTFSANVLIFIYFLPTLVFNAPLWYFIFAYVELHALMNVWCDEIKKFKEPKILLFEQAKYFIDGLNEVANCFSCFLFWIISCGQLLVIFSAYYILTSSYNIDPRWEKICLVIGFAVTELSFIYMLFGMCTVSEHVAKNVQELKKVLLNIEFETGQSNSVCLMIDDFHGFDADGYFTLNHSLLTGMTTNFLTFLVILVQFKQSGI